MPAVSGMVVPGTAEMTKVKLVGKVVVPLMVPDSVMVVPAMAVITRPLLAVALADGVALLADTTSPTASLAASAADTVKVAPATAVAVTVATLLLWPVMPETPWEMMPGQPGAGWAAQVPELRAGEPSWAEPVPGSVPWPKLSVICVPTR